MGKSTERKGDIKKKRDPWDMFWGWSGRAFRLLCDTSYKRWLSVCRPFSHWTLSFFLLPFTGCIIKKRGLSNRNQLFKLPRDISKRRGERDHDETLKDSQIVDTLFPFSYLLKENYLSAGSLIKFHSRDGLGNATRKTELTKRCVELVFFFASLSVPLPYF